LQLAHFKQSQQVHCAQPHLPVLQQSPQGAAAMTFASGIVENASAVTTARINCFIELLSLTEFLKTSARE
jgi:hypothetical protein